MGARIPTYLGLSFPLPLWVSFTDEIKIFLVELLLFLALNSAALFLLSTLTLF
jgi:hypothetical protein